MKIRIALFNALGLFYTQEKTHGPRYIIRVLNARFYHDSARLWRISNQFRQEAQAEKQLAPGWTPSWSHSRRGVHQGWNCQISAG